MIQQTPSLPLLGPESLGLCMQCVSRPLPILLDLLFSVPAVAATVGKGIIQPSFSTVDVIFAGLIGAIIWDLVTWYFGLPSSSSHALIGGLIGSGLVAGGTSALVAPGIEKTLTFLVVSPALGFSCAFAIALLVMYFFQKPDIFACQQAFWPSSNLFFNLFLPYSWCERRSKDNGSHHCPVDCRGIP